MENSLSELLRTREIKTRQKRKRVIANVLIPCQSMMKKCIILGDYFFAKETGMKKQPLDRSFGYAFEGIWNTVKSERNMQIHLGFTVCVIIAGLIFRISKIEWLFCLVLFGQVMSLELVNTALEAAVDVATDEWKPLAKKAKDAAAGAVLVSAIMAAVIGLLIFIPRLFDLIYALAG